MATTATVTRWALKGRGYEFCNCDFGCGCNFGGFPNSKDGSCRALVGMVIDNGSCGRVDLSGVKCAAIVAWPKAVHEVRISNLSLYCSTPGPPALSFSTWDSVSSAASS